MTAPLQGALRYPAHRFVLGTFEVTTILDGTINMGVSPPFMLDESEDEIAVVAKEALIPSDQLENNFVPTLVNTGDALVLFDTGCGHYRRDKGAGFLRERLGDAGYAPEDVDVVAFTHVHPDHIGGVYEDGAFAFRNAELVIGRQEYTAWKSGERIPPQRAENREMFLEIIASQEDRLRFLDDGDDVVPGVTAEAAFGHSLGHMMYRIRSEDSEALIWGDVANHYVFSVGRPRSKVAFDDDKDMAIETRIRVLESAVAESTLIIGFHMPFPSIGYVEREGEGYRWLPATYQVRL